MEIGQRGWRSEIRLRDGSSLLYQYKQARCWNIRVTVSIQVAREGGDRVDSKGERKECLLCNTQFRDEIGRTSGRRRGSRCLAEKRKVTVSDETG